MVGVELPAIHSEDDIFFLRPAFAAGLSGTTAASVGLSRTTSAPNGAGKLQFFFKGFVDHDIAEAEERSADAAVFFQVIHVALRFVHGDRKADALRAGDDRGIHADHAAVAVHERPAGIARIDRGIRLDEAAHFLPWRIRIYLRRDRARKAGDDAEGHGIFEHAERVSDGDDALPKLQLLRIAELKKGQFVGFDLQDRDVVDRVAASGSSPRNGGHRSE